ncbi:MAG: hypothetical protein QOK84_09520, partial [Nitrososphaeraceae archaeon]|nr:hypothetical protein [Nitrososphaeraceae archaeon]
FNDKILFSASIITMFKIRSILYFKVLKPNQNSLSWIHLNNLESLNKRNKNTRKNVLEKSK